MIDRSIARARLLPLLGVLLAACSATVSATPAGVAPSVTPVDTAPRATFAPPPTPEPTVDLQPLPSTTTTGWWGDPDRPSECMALGEFRVGAAVAMFGDCFGMPIEGPKEVTLDVGQDMDIHMTITTYGEPPIYALPEPEDPLIVRGWLIYDDATLTYRGLLPGTTRLVSPGSCLRSDPLPRRPVPSPAGECVLLTVHVRDIETDCVELPEDLCRIAAAQAVIHGVFPQPGQKIVGWVARPDSFIGGADCGDGVAKVTFGLTDPDGEYPVQIGRLVSASGEPHYVVCTY